MAPWGCTWEVSCDGPPLCVPQRKSLTAPLLLPTPCSEGLLSDLQAGDSGLPTPSQGTGALHSPRTPAPARPAAPPREAPGAPPPTPPLGPVCEEAAPDALPRLPRIRTRVGQPRPGSEGGDEGGSGSGSGEASGRGSQ